MPSLGIRPTSITLFPTAADRSTIIPTSHQQHYLSPPLTPYPHLHGYDDTLKSSPPSSYHPSLPTLREMLPLESRQQHSPSDPEQHAYVHPAPQPHSQRDLTELSDLNHDTAPRGVQHATDPSRIISHYSSQSHNGVVQSASISPLLRRNKAHVASACVNCKKAHLACDANRPCRRCVSLDKQDSCIDVQHKRRGRPRLKDSAPSVTSLQSERRPSYLQRHVSDDSWKLQSSSSSASHSSYTRGHFHREPQYQHHPHHNRSYSQGSQSSVVPRHHPYANPTPPTSGYALTTPAIATIPSRNSNTVSNSTSNTGYFDLPSPSSTSHPSYSTYPAPLSPNYYPYPNSQLSGPQPRDTFSTPLSPYPLTSTQRPETQLSGPPARSQPLLPLPESSNILRRDSFTSESHYSQRPALNRADSTPAPVSGHERAAAETDVDSVTLPSLKDLGVPLR